MAVFLRHLFLGHPESYSESFLTPTGNLASSTQGRGEVVCEQFSALKFENWNFSQINFHVTIITCDHVYSYLIYLLFITWYFLFPEPNRGCMPIHHINVHL
jgi:hypothetical protein